MQNLVGIILVLGFIVSCGQRKAPQNDPRFDIYKIQFQAEAKKRGVDISNGELTIPVAFGATGDGTDGICTVPAMGRNAFDAATNDLFNRDNYDRKFIIINPSILDKDLFYIEAVVFHELAHCLIGREHTEERSIMNRSQERNGEYPILRKIYLDELFGVEANFEGNDLNNTCSLPGPKTEIIDEVQYRAFDRQLTYVMYSGQRESSEVFCINSYLK